MTVTLASGASGAGKPQPGSIDPSFGEGGSVKTPLGVGGPQSPAVALQADGKLIVGGYRNLGSGRGTFTILRYKPNGEVDKSFGKGGEVETEFVTPGLGAAIRAVVVQPDGKIVAAGWAASGARNSLFAVVRYNANGSIDRTFGTDGKVMTSIGLRSADVSSLILEPNGKLLVAGVTNDDGSGPGVFALVRYTASGSLDKAFGTGGKVTTAIYRRKDTQIFDTQFVMQPNGRIVASGFAIYNGSPGAFVLLRYKPNGSLDASFGDRGKVIATAAADFLGQALVLLPDGQIVAAGDVYRGRVTHDVFALARYNADGVLDAGFGRHGEVETPFGPDTAAAAHALALQPDGELVAAGDAGPSGSSRTAGVLVRYKASGSLDRSFGVNGTVTTAIGSSVGTDVLLRQRDGKLIAGGYSYRVGGAPAFVLRRYNA